MKLLNLTWLLHFQLRLYVKTMFNHINKFNVEGGVSLTWAVHHASKCQGLQFRPCISVLMPLLSEQAHSVATVKHAMNKIKEAKQYLDTD